MRTGTLLILLAGVAVAACAKPTASDDVNLAARAEPGACVKCHQTDFDQARHHKGLKPTTCGTCHSQSGWHPVRIDHSWKLDGAHEKTDCLACHKGEPATFRGLAKECVDCHREDDTRANAKLDWHVRGGLECADCHSTTAWKPPLAEAEAEWQATLAASAKAPPPPPATATAKPTATATAKPTATATAKPKPTATATAVPTSTATAWPTATATATPPPDIVTSSSTRKRGSSSH